MRSFLRITLVVLCWTLLVGVRASIAQVPDPSPAGAPSRDWKACAERLSSPVELSKSLQTQFARPQNIYQMLQNLKLAWENNWLLRPDFYDEETLLKFFNGTAVAWKQHENDRFPTEEIRLETDSHIFPQMSVVVEAHCRSRGSLSVGGYISIYGRPIPELTLATIRQVLGPETRNALDSDYLGESGNAPTNKGSVDYTDPAREKQEGRRMGLTFNFSIPSKSPESFQREIGADDVVQGILLSAARHQTVGN